MNQVSEHVWKKLDIIILTILLLIGVSLRVYKINTPLADFQSFRQTEVALEAKQLIKNNFLVENRKIPLYNLTTAALYVKTHTVTLEMWGRIISILSSLVIIGLIYYFCLKEIGRVGALFGALFYTMFPFVVFFSRTYLPQNPALAMALLSIFSLYLVKDKEDLKKILLYTSLFVSSLLFCVGLFLDGSIIFYILPILYIFLAKYRKNLYKQPLFYLYLFIAFIPFALSGVYQTKIPPFTVNLDLFRWVFYDQLVGVMLGGFAIFFLILGIIRKQKSFFSYTLLLTAVFYLVIIEGIGNSAFEYRQIILLPITAFFIGSGIEFPLIAPRKKMLSPILSRTIVFFLIVASILFSYMHVKDYYTISNELPQIAQIIKTFTKPEDTLVLDKNGDSTLLYLSDRRGTGRKHSEIPDLQSEGFDYLVTFNQEYTDYLKKQYQTVVVFENDKLTLFKL